MASVINWDSLQPSGNKIGQKGADGHSGLDN